MCKNITVKISKTSSFMVKYFCDKYAKRKTYVRKQARTNMSTMTIFMFIPFESYALDMLLYDLFNHVSNDKK